jgi:hypothetical protein
MVIAKYCILFYSVIKHLYNSSVSVKGLNQENINIGRESWSIYTVPISPQLFNTCSTAVKN